MAVSSSIRARTFGENEVLVATRLAAERIAQRRVGELDQMGSTVAILRFAGDHAVVGHVGDSRVYRLRAGALAQLTVDHSLVAQLDRTPEAAGRRACPWRHVVTRALGTPHRASRTCGSIARAPGDVYLLCSDGLSEVLSTQVIASLLDSPVEVACRALVDAAFAAGSRDNISAIVVRVG